MFESSKMFEWRVTTVRVTETTGLDAGNYLVAEYAILERARHGALCPWDGVGI